MHIVGWIALGLVGAVGLALIACIAFEFFTTFIKTLKTRIANEVDVQKTHSAANAELKKERLARKRLIEDQIANAKLKVQMEKKKTEAGKKLGVIFPHNHDLDAASGNAIKVEELNEGDVGNRFLNLGGVSMQQHKTKRPQEKEEAHNDDNNSENNNEDNNDNNNNASH